MNLLRPERQDPNKSVNWPYSDSHASWSLNQTDQPNLTLFMIKIYSIDRKLTKTPKNVTISKHTKKQKQKISLKIVLL